jgi:ABC-type glycerol-3-phosphate transport system substrate-binding protein
VRVKWVLAGEQDIVDVLLNKNSDVAPDLVFVSDQDLPGLVEQGALADLSSWMSPYESQMLKYKLTLVSPAGKVFALPVDTQPAALFYRRDAFEQAGLPSDPKSVGEKVSTWDGLLAACRQIYAKARLACFTANRAGNDGRLAQMIAWQSGAGLYDAAGKPALNTPEVAKALDTLAPFWKENLAGDMLEGSGEWLDALNDPKKPLAIAIEPATFAADLKTWAAPGMSGKWGVVPIPALAAGQARAASMGGINLAIPAASPNAAAARSFMEYLFLRSEAQGKLFTGVGNIPAIRFNGTGAAGSAAVDAYFAGQALGMSFGDIASQIPDVRIYGSGYHDVTDWLARAAQLVAVRSFPAQKALDQAQSAALGTPTPTMTPTAETQ